MTKFYEDFPKTDYTYNEKLQSGEVKERKIKLTDLSFKFKVPDRFLTENFINNTESVYTTRIDDNMRPDLVSSIYYEDPYKYWAVLLANDIYNPYTGFPIPVSLFDEYLFKKYRRDHGIFVLSSQGVDFNSTLDNVKLDSAEKLKTFLNSPESNVNSVIAYTKDIKVEFVHRQAGYKVGRLDFEANSSAFRAVSIYDKEFDINENRRELNFISTDHIEKLENDLADALSLIEE